MCYIVCAFTFSKSVMPQEAIWKDDLTSGEFLPQGPGAFLQNLFTFH